MGSILAEGPITVTPIPGGITKLAEVVVQSGDEHKHYALSVVLQGIEVVDGMFFPYPDGPSNADRGLTWLNKIYTAVTKEKPPGTDDAVIVRAYLFNPGASFGYTGSYELRKVRN